MRGNALKLGFSLNEHGIYKKQPGQRAKLSTTNSRDDRRSSTEFGREKEEKVGDSFKDERDIFTFLKMEYREPVERDERGKNTPVSEPPKEPVPVQEPIKKESPVIQTKKKRGRPPKKVEPSKEQELTQEPIKKESPMVQTKKKRGRPPKKVELTQEPIKKESPVIQTKKKRGRPPKKQGSPQNKDGQDKIGVEVPPKNVTMKKRGRPKKIKEPEIALVPPVFPEKIGSPSKKEKSPEVPIIPVVPKESLKKKTSPLSKTIKNSPENKIKTIRNKTIRKMSGKTAAKKNIALFKKEGIKVLELLPENDVEAMVVTANDAYYNSKNPLLTDNEYDIVREYAETKYPDNETIKQVGAPITKNKVTLPYNMPSMDKIKPDTNALATWMQKYKGPYVLSCKLDGVSGLYTTEGSEPKLYTRGDGKVGQDITHLLRVLNLPKPDKTSGFVSGKPEGFATDKTNGFVVRGEFIIPKRTFDDKYKSQFANPRNLVSGIVNSKTLDDKTRDLHFVAYEVIHPPMKVGEQMATLKKLGFEVVQNESVDSLSNDLLSKTLLDWRSRYEYEIDGVIVADDNIHPRKDGNPEYAFAFKMVISDQMAEAKVVDVLWEPSKSGYLKPRVQIEPIRLGGVTIQYATGFNGDFIEKNKIGVGAVIQIVRSGDVIPHIKSVTTPAEQPKMPDQKYVWTKNHVDIVLENVEEDVTVKRKNITEFFTKLEVDGLSGKTVEKIMDAGFDTVPKILKMTKADFAKVKGFQETLVNKIHDGIRVQVEKASLLEIMAASNMFGRGIGERKIKPILEAEPTILTDPGTTQEKYERLIKIKGIGQENAKSFTENIDRFMGFLKDCELEGKLTEQPKQPTPKKVDASHPLYEKHIVMSGVRDATVKQKTESIGGVIDDNVGKNTFILVVKSKDSETSKTKYAKANGIEIMEPAEFLTKYFE
jgi:NAD-dependent DNA ligase